MVGCGGGACGSLCSYIYIFIYTVDVTLMGTEFCYNMGGWGGVWCLVSCEQELPNIISPSRIKSKKKRKAKPLIWSHSGHCCCRCLFLTEYVDEIMYMNNVYDEDDDEYKIMTVSWRAGR